MLQIFSATPDGETAPLKTGADVAKGLTSIARYVNRIFT
jgi:hypothetical protein